MGRENGSHDRKDCDRCHVAKDLLEQSSTMRCEKMLDRDLCTVCHAFGSPVCTWSLNDTLKTNLALVRALWYTKSKDYGNDLAALMVEDNLAPAVFQPASR